MPKSKSFLITFFLINIVILVHELGHLFGAYLFKVPVKQLSLGFGPSIASFNLNNLDIFIRVFPLGAFVELDSHLFTTPNWEIIIISALGPIFNFSLAFIFSYILIYQRLTRGFFFTDANENLYYKWNTDLYTYNKTRHFFEAADDAVPLILTKRETKFKEFIFVPFFFLFRHFSDKSINLLNIYFQEIKIKNYERNNQRRIQGPVAIFKEMALFTQVGWEWSLLSAANISLSLGIFNLLPLAFLDGGKITTHGLSLVLNIPLARAAFISLIAIMLLIGGLLTSHLAKKNHE